MNVVDAGGPLELSVEYSTELFDADRIERLVGHVTEVLAGGLATPGAVADDLEMMSREELDRALHAGNDTAVAYAGGVPYTMIEATAARTPDAVAVVDPDGGTWSYRRLDEAANQLAHRLRRHGVGPGVPVGIHLPRGADLVVSLLATWKAGGGYVPSTPSCRRTASR